jgi:hypothetical protein
MFAVQQSPARTLIWWLEQRDEIDFSPAYQRQGGVWTDYDKAYLIDSIINEFDIPKFYFADFTYASTPLNLKRKRYAIIDGKQRFEAILSFFDGTLSLNKDFVYLSEPTLKLAGLSYKDLKTNYPKVAMRFENFNPTIMSVITDDEGLVSDLFVRLNRSRPLAGSEVRNAMKGLVADRIRDLAGHRFFKENIRFSTKRMQQNNTAAKLLLIEHRGKLVDTKKANLDRLVVEGAQAGSASADFTRAATRVSTVLNGMADLIFTKRDPLLQSEGPVPIYYWLARNTSVGHNMIREFLLNFEDSRKRNREVPPNSDAADRELLEYDIYNRATNDAGSLSARYVILLNRFRAFLIGRGVTVEADQPQ